MSNRQPFDTAPKDRPIIAFTKVGTPFIVHYSLDGGFAEDGHVWACWNGGTTVHFNGNTFTTWAEIPE